MVLPVLETRRNGDFVSRHPNPCASCHVISYTSVPGAVLVNPTREPAAVVAGVSGAAGVAFAEQGTADRLMTRHLAVPDRPVLC